MRAKKTSIKLEWHRWIATLLGLGYAPKWAGTLGSTVTVVVVFLGAVLANTHWMVLLAVLCAILLLLGTYAVHLYLQDLARHALPHNDRNDLNDPSEVIIDEALGMTITLLILWGWLGVEMITMSVSSLGVSFVGWALFRIFDGWKIGLVAQAERLPGAWGVMTDDIVAGILAGISGGVIVQAAGYLQLVFL